MANNYKRWLCEESLKTDQYKIWTADCGLRITDYGLRTGYKKRTRYKTRTGKHGLGIKHGQGIKRGLDIKSGLRTTLVKTVLIGNKVKRSLNSKTRELKL